MDAPQTKVVKIFQDLVVLTFRIGIGQRFAERRAAEVGIDGHIALAVVTVDLRRTRADRNIGDIGQRRHANQRWQAQVRQCVGIYPFTQRAGGG
jgi:hypothetical protein